MPAKIINFSFIGGYKQKMNKPPQELMNNTVLNKKIYNELYKEKN